MIEKIRWDIFILYIDVAFQDLTPSLGTLGFSEKIQGTDKEQKQTAPEPEKNI